MSTPTVSDSAIPLDRGGTVGSADLCEVTPTMAKRSFLRVSLVDGGPMAGSGHGTFRERDA